MLTAKASDDKARIIIVLDIILGIFKDEKLSNFMRLCIFARKILMEIIEIRNVWQLTTSTINVVLW